MKKSILIILAIGVLGVGGYAITNIKSDQTEPTFTASAVANLEKYELSELVHGYAEIQNMTCISCATGIEYSMKNLEGVTDASVSYEKGNAEIIYNPSLVSEDDIAAAADPYPIQITKTEKATFYSLN